MQPLTQEEISEIRENPDKANWYRISRNQKLSEDFIREFKDKVQWHLMSYNQTLSEDFIREFQDRMGSVGVVNLRRPLSYDEIMSYDPCLDGVERYLKHTSKEETITWDTLLERHSDKSDIKWLFSKRDAVNG